MLPQYKSEAPQKTYVAIFHVRKYEMHISNSVHYQTLTKKPQRVLDTLKEMHFIRASLARSSASWFLMTPQCGAHITRLQQHILVLSATSIWAIINSTDLCPVNSTLMSHNIMNAGVCNIHSTNCLLSKCFLCL